MNMKSAMNMNKCNEYAGRHEAATVWH